MPNARQEYRGRFAPSPSGPLHFGSLVAAIGSYLDAKNQGGAWLLRIEDLDPPRVQPGMADHILRTLDAFGFEWDGEVLYQSNRFDAYHAALEKLQADGHCYACACTRKTIRDAGLRGLDGPRYPGTCRTGLAAGAAPRALRLRTDHSETVFIDRRCGIQRQRIEATSGDFVIRRADGPFAYQLAVVVDDAFQGITDVVRGADLLLSTPRQIWLQRLLDLDTPSYLHLPLVTDASGRKLSKQARDHPVESGNPLPALLDALAFLGQPLPKEKPSRLGEFWHWAITHWRIDDIPEATL